MTRKKLIEKYKEELIEAFKIECLDRSAQIDPNADLDWFALTLGWALGKSLTPDEANDLAVHIRYNWLRKEGT